MSDFYGTVEAFKDYHMDRGSDVEGISDNKIQMGLLRMSEWLDATYRHAFPGDKFGQREQIRDWPRLDAYDVNDDYITSDFVPVEIEHATYVATLKWLNDPSVVDRDYTPSQYTKARVEGAVSVEYAFHNDASDVATRFATVDKILSAFVGSLEQGANILSGESSR